MLNNVYGRVALLKIRMFGVNGTGGGVTHAVPSTDIYIIYLIIVASNDGARGPWGPFRAPLFDDAKIMRQLTINLYGTGVRDGPGG